MRWFWNQHEPSSVSSKPVARLKKVVLPAPLGPMSAVMTPRWISMLSMSTALNAPKERTSPSAVRIGSGFGTPGRDSKADIASADIVSGTVLAATASGAIQQRLLFVAEEPLRAENHQQHKN